MDDQQLLRYGRQILLPQIDIAGQQTLLKSSVLIVGLGGLGAPAALYLAAAGVGRLLLADHDSVDTTNLHRQIIHLTRDVGRAKVESAGDTLRALNTDVQLTLIERELEGETLTRAVQEVDLVLDCTDNFATRLAVNAACFAAGKPLVSGAAIRLEGQVSVFDPRLTDSPCYQCLYGESGEEALSCSEAGVIGPLVGMIGSLQALEALKLLVGFGEPLTGRLLLIDALTSRFREMRIKRDPACSCCGTGGRGQ
ncbi:molybdopterin-synthase adenylyltransferase MoeB [Pseudomonas saliphila]|uniref:molybdopterin-synthase adenylyltransferase MoeB n=1 Tax=Pseudomonas saliphila TaxID=2586906 RepID=UPI0038B6AB3C